MSSYYSDLYEFNRPLKLKGAFRTMNLNQLRNLEQKIQSKVKEILEEDFESHLLSLDLDSMVQEALEKSEVDIEATLQEAMQEHVESVVDECIKSSIEEIVSEKL